MSEQKHKLTMMLGMVDNLTGPIQKVTTQTAKVGDQIKVTQDRLKQLGQQQSDIDHFKKLKSSASQTANALQVANEKVSQLAAGMQSSASPTKKMIKEFNQAQQAAKKLKEQHAQETSQLQQLRSKLNDSGISTRRLSEAVRKIRSDTSLYNKELVQQQAHLDQVAQRQNKLQAIRNSATNASGAIAGVAGGLSLAGMSDPALQAQQAASQLAATHGQGRAEAEKYRDMITKIYSSNTYSMAETQEAISAVTSTLGGLNKASSESIIALTQNAAAISQAYGIAATDSVQMASQLVKNGLVQNTTQAFDLIGAGLQQMSASMRGELPDILNEYGTHFKNMGFSGDEAMRLLVDASKSGKIALDKTGDAIKEFTLRGSNMSKSSVEAYEQIGLSAADMAHAIVQGGPSARDALTQTAKGLLAISDPAERANAAIALFGTPLEDLSIDKIPEFLNAMASAGGGMGNLTGTADKLADTLNNNGLSSIQLLGKALSGSMMKTFNDLEPQIIAVTSAVKGFIENNPKVVTAVVSVGALIATLAAVGGITSLVITALSGLGAILTTIKLVTSLLTLEQMKLTASMMFSRVTALASGVALLALSGTQKALAAGTAIMTGAQWALNAAMTANPIGLIIAGVAALVGVVALVVKYWEPLGAFFSGLWDSLKTTFSIGWEFIKSILAYSPLGLVMQAWDPLTEFFGGLWERVTGVFSSGMEHIAGMLSTVSGWWDSLFGDDDQAEKRLNVTQTMTNAAAAMPAVTNPAAIPAFNPDPYSAMSPVGVAPAVGVVGGGVPARTSESRTYQDNSQVHIEVHAAPGMNERELAAEIDKRLDQRNREAMTRYRGRLYD